MGRDLDHSSDQIRALGEIPTVHRRHAGSLREPIALALEFRIGALDRDVTVADPRAAEETFARDFEGARTAEDLERAAAESLQRRLESGEDVPLIEDFPLAPEEETPEFQHLAATLQFRFVRAFEHWQGNTHLTLTAIIMRTVQQNMGAMGAER